MGDLPQNSLHDDLMVAIKEQSKYHTNVNQVFIQVTEDKVDLTLRDFESATFARFAWALPVGFLLGIIATLTTSTFHDAFGIEKEQWKAIFQVLGFIMVLWIAWELSRVRKFWGKATRSHVIEQLKSATARGNTPSTPPPAPP